MSSTERTLAKVSEEFLSEVKTEISKAKQDIIQRIDREQREVAELVSRVVENGEKQAESLKRQIVGSAEIEARNYQLKVMEDAFTDVIDKAIERIKNLDEERYKDAISRMLLEAYETIGKECVVYCNKEDRSIVSSSIRKLKLSKVSLSSEHIESSGGIIVESKDKTIRFDNTVEARMERMRQELRKEVSSILTL